MSAQPLLNSLAVVLPRYGKSLGGGAETLVRALALQLHAGKAEGRFIPHVEVWTTCAKDHRTWANDYPPGATEEDGVVVRRFPVDERDLEIFIRSEIALQEGRRLTVEQQLAWLENGVNSRALYAHIAAHGQEFDALLFAPYLFPTTFWGSLIHPTRSLLLPCLHNEGYAYFEVFRHLFSEVRAVLFNAHAEGDLADRLYQLPDLAQKSGVVGMGFPPPIESAAARSASASIEPPYLLYSGRKETGKNLDLLIDCMEQARERLSRPDLELRLIGSGNIDFRAELPAGVSDLGFVSEEEKHRLMAGALALCQPSVNESFSIVLMEAWRYGVPVIVHGECEVTRQHCERSGGGLWFSGKEEFREVVEELLRSPTLRQSLGAAGMRYVQEEYSWDAVINRFAAIIEKVGLRSGQYDTSKMRETVGQ